MLRVALQMLFHKPVRSLATAVGLGALFFLSAAQVGLMVGWCQTCSALIRHAGVDLWVVAEQTPAFDYGTAIPRQRLYQVRGVSGVGWAEGLVHAWNIWQRPDGRRVNVEMIGLDDSSVGGPWRMQQGQVSNVHLPDGVIVDELYVRDLGVTAIGDTVELLGRRAVVRGFSRDVRTLTASPFVFTSITSAIAYDRRYRDDEITYVMARVAPGRSVEEVAAAVREVVPYCEVLTTHDFAVRTMRYWMLETGLGITVVLTAILGFTVSALVMSQTLYSLTQDHLPHYVTLLALGFSRSRLRACILWQTMLLTSCGIVVGSVLFVVASRLSQRTVIPIETTLEVSALLMVLELLSAVVGSLLSLRVIWSAEPATVFRT